MLWSIESCQNMVSPDQYHVTISLAQVKGKQKTSLQCYKIQIHILTYPGLG